MDTKDFNVEETMTIKIKKGKKKAKSGKLGKTMGIVLLVLSVMLVYVYFWTVQQFGNIPFAQRIHYRKPFR